MLRSPTEVQLVLRGLLDRVSQITVFFNEGNDMLLTTLAHVASDHLILDHGPSQETNRKALEADKHFCVTMLDKVRIQFVLRDFTGTEHEGRPAFRCAPPDELLRLQRREFYRLVTPVARPLKCAIPIHHPDGTQLHETNILDISNGGVCLLVPPEGVAFESGMEFPGCRIELPEVGILNNTLKVINIFEVTLKSGARMLRAGCEFENIPGPMMTLIQRYIVKVERERKARESGMG